MSDPTHQNPEHHTLQHVPHMPSRVPHMPSVLTASGVQMVARHLVRELGLPSAIGVLFRSMVWDYLFHRPTWDVSRFRLDTPADEQRYREVFGQLVPVMLIMGALERRVGHARADEIMAGMAISSSLPYLMRVFRSGLTIRNIDDVRQLMADYLGDGSALPTERRPVHHVGHRLVVPVVFRIQDPPRRPHARHLL